MFLLKPTGRFPVGCQDLKYYPDRTAAIAADNHVVGRLFYPARPQGQGLLSRVLSPPTTWIRDWHYAKGYVSWGLRNPSTAKEKSMKAAAQNTVFGLGLTRWLTARYNAAPEDRQGAYPVIVFSHGAASMRNTYSITCSELASRGFVVAAVEHADGTACCTELANGEWKLLQGLGTGAALEAKCDYRVEECRTMARVLQALSTGADVAGLQLSGAAAAPASAFKGLLDLDRLAVMGHSCGGATAAAAVAEHPVFKCGIALDPWWPLLPSNSAALKGWKTSGPLLVLGSQSWNMPGKMWCDGPRQEAVFAACKPVANGTNNSSSSGAASRPLPRGVPVAAAAAAANGSNGSSSSSSSGAGGGAIHIVPAGSGHASFCDLPFLISPWVSRQLRALSGASKPSPESEVAPSVIQDAIVWCSHTFLSAHLPLPDAHPASLAQQQRWEAARGGGSGSSSSSNSQERDLSPSGAAGQEGGLAAAAAGAAASSGRGMERAESLMDHLAADENFLAADEAAGHASNGVAAAAGRRAPAPPLAHSAGAADAALGQAADAGLAAAAAAAHLPVQPSELAHYKEHLGDTAYLVQVYV